MTRTPARLLPILLLACVACNDEPADDEPACVACEDAGAQDATGPVLPPQLGITADWLEHSLSYVDMDALRDGVKSREAAVVHTLELPEFEPGPLELELTPDGKTALVSVSAGFFGLPFAPGLVAADSTPQGDGTLLFIDVDRAEVSATLDTGKGPMGIAFTPDGTRAFVAHFTSGDIAVVDVADRSLIERVEVGVFAEEIALDETGTVGIVGYSTDGSVRTFSTKDLAGSLSPQVKLAGDSAGVAFFPGTKLALVVQAPNPLSSSSGYTLVDASKPSSPKVLEDVRFDQLATGYPAVAAPARDSILVPVTTEGRLVVREYRLDERRVVLAQSVDVTEGNLLTALGVAYDGDHTVVMALARTRSLAVADLESGDVHVVPWIEGDASPADVVIRARE